MGLDRPDVETHGSFRTHRPLVHMPERRLGLRHRNFRRAQGDRLVERVMVDWTLPSPRSALARVGLAAWDGQGESLAQVKDGTAGDEVLEAAIVPLRTEERDAE